MSTTNIKLGLELWYAGDTTVLLQPSNHRLVRNAVLVVIIISGAIEESCAYLFFLAEKICSTIFDSCKLEKREVLADAQRLWFTCRPRMRLLVLDRPEYYKYQGLPAKKE